MAMSPTEYQELVTFIGRRFDTIADRFDRVDRRFDALQAHIESDFEKSTATSTRFTGAMRSIAT